MSLPRLQCRDFDCEYDDIFSYFNSQFLLVNRRNETHDYLASSRLQGGKTFCASFCASLIAGSRRAFLCVDCVCLLLKF